MVFYDEITWRITTAIRKGNRTDMVRTDLCYTEIVDKESYPIQ